MSDVEKRFREILAHTAETGSDPFLALSRAGLIHTDGKVFSGRRDTLIQAAHLFEDKVDSAIPAHAKTSAGAMKAWIISELRNLAHKQVHRG